MAQFKSLLSPSCSYLLRFVKPDDIIPVGRLANRVAAFVLALSLCEGDSFGLTMKCTLSFKLGEAGKHSCKIFRGAEEVAVHSGSSLRLKRILTFFHRLSRMQN